MTNSPSMKAAASGFEGLLKISRLANAQLSAIKHNDITGSLRAVARSCVRSQPLRRDRYFCGSIPRNVLCCWRRRRDCRAASTKPTKSKIHYSPDLLVCSRTVPRSRADVALAHRAISRLTTRKKRPTNDSNVQVLPYRSFIQYEAARRLGIGRD